MFGELSVLTPNGKTSARVVADENGTEIYHISMQAKTLVFISEL